MFKKATLILLFILAITVGFGVSNQQKASAVAEHWQCEWQNDARINCRKPSGASQFAGSFTNTALDWTTIIGTGGPTNPVGLVASVSSDKFTDWLQNYSQSYANITCVTGSGDCGDFYYEPGASGQAGYPVYCYYKDGTIGGKEGLNDKYRGCLHFATGSPIAAFHNNSWGKINVEAAVANTNDISDDTPNWWTIGNVPAALNKTKRWCSLSNTTNCEVDSSGVNYSGDLNGLGPQAVNGKLIENIKAVSDAIAFNSSCEKTAPIKEITCPIFNSILEGIAGLIGGASPTGAREGILNNLLELPPLTSNQQGNANILQAFVGQLITVANVLYLIVFILLIFSSSLPFGLDNYTIKKTLPKFIAAVILTQFAYLICGVIVDFFNLLGNLVPNLVFGLPQGLNANLALPTGLGAGEMLMRGLQLTMFAPLVGFTAFLLAPLGIFIIIILAIVVFIAAIVTVIFLVLRILLLYVLILLAPLAFAAWVLPGTENLFKTWWKNFIRLNVMYPMITGLIAVAVLLARIFMLL